MAAGLAVVILAGAGVACSSGDDTAGTANTPAASNTPAVSAVNTANTEASELRSNLNTLLEEHVYLAAGATGAALGGRTAEFDAGAKTLDANSVALSKAIGSVYGNEAEAAFLPLWRKHIGFFVDYTQGAAAKDTAKQQKAMADLTQYSQDFAAFLSAANPNLPKDTVVKLLGDHAMTLITVIDAQAAGNLTKAYTDMRAAAGHMHMIADPLAGAIAKQFPEKFPGKVDAAGATLRSNLNTMLAEHVYLAGYATGGALGGRTPEFKEAAGALDANSVALSKAIGSVYGNEAEAAFLPLWRKHIGFFVDYTQGAAAKDMAKQQKAMADLTQYAQDFAAFLSAANPNLPKETVAKLLGEHASSLIMVINAQAAGDAAKAYTDLRTAAGHMHIIADPLAGAIVTQFPAKFAVAAPASGADATSAHGSHTP